MDGAAPDFFDHDYRRVLAPFHTEAETRSEVGAIRELAGLAQGERVLDLACGWGRHLLHLNEAGHDVVGVDGSPALLAEVHRAPGLAIVCSDMRALPFGSGAFDAVLNIETSLGLFLEDAAAVEALSEACRVLRPRGRLLLSGMHRDEVVARYAARDRWTLEDGTEVRARRRFDPLTGISEEILRWRGEGGAGEKRHRLRLRSGTEMARLVGEAGLRIRGVWGDWYGRPLRRRSPLLVLLADRPS